MNKNLVSFLVFVVGLAVFHNAIFPIFTPKPVEWILNRYVYYLVFIAFLIITHFVLRLKPSIALKALFVWFLGYYFYEAILFPPIPWTLFITYMMMWSIGVFLYISQDAETFREFREPIAKTIVGEYKFAQIVVMIAMPILVGFATYKSIYPAYQEPVELRTFIPHLRLPLRYMAKPIRWSLPTIRFVLMNRTTIRTVSRFWMRTSTNT